METLTLGDEMKLFKKPGRRYEPATRAEIVLTALQILNDTPGGKEVTDLFALKSMQGKIVIRQEPAKESDEKGR